MPGAAAAAVGRSCTASGPRTLYSRMVNDFLDGRASAVRTATSADAPPGSGLGPPLALVVVLVQAFAQVFHAALAPHQVERMVFEIERIDLGMAGGRQGQYAAVFGGVNFIEFLGADKVMVKPVPLPESHRGEFENCLFVCHTGPSRLSSNIIEQQAEGLRRNVGESV